MMIAQSLDTRQLIPHVARMLAENIQAWIDDGHPDDDWSRWTVTSGTVPGLLYTVIYEADAEGQKLLCDCDAGQHGLACKHGTAVAVAMHIIDVDDVLAEAERIRVERDAERAQVLEERKVVRAAEAEAKRQAKLFQTGDRVRVKRNQHVEIANRLGVVERTYTHHYRVTLERTAEYGALTFLIEHDGVAASVKPPVEPAVTPEADAAMRALLTGGRL